MTVASDGSGPTPSGPPASGAATGRSLPWPVRRGAPSRGRRLRATLALATIETSLLVRSLLVAGGLVAGAGLVWGVTQQTLPLWWDVGWRLGYGQMVLSSTVLVATHLAAGRVRRDGLQDLYASFPTAAGPRTAAQLIATVGALPAGLLLIGAAAAVFQLRGAVGTPDAAVLAGGLLLVVAGATIGVAVAVRFPHPLAGILAAFVWFGAFSQTNRFNSGVAWLLPWTFSGWLGQLPAPLPGYPPGAAHDAELAGIAALAAAVALAATAGSRRLRLSLLGVGAVAMAVAGLAGSMQLQPVRTAALDHLAQEVADPAAVQQCTATNGVRYCVYPGFGSLVPVLSGPVNGVLAGIPARPPRALTVRQLADITFEGDLTYGHSTQQVNGWAARIRSAPMRAPAADAIYSAVGRWPAGGADLSAARFDVALGAAEWAVGLPPATAPGSDVGASCVPLHQAREAIAIWLAVQATHPATSALRAGLPAVGPGFGTYTPVAGTTVAIWTYPGDIEGYVVSGPQLTADGYLLAHAMAALPAKHVRQTLERDWARWLDPRTDAAQLAAALGIARPTFPVPPLVAAHPPPGPRSPVCP